MENNNNQNTSMFRKLINPYFLALGGAVVAAAIDTGFISHANVVTKSIESLAVLSTMLCAPLFVVKHKMKEKLDEHQIKLSEIDDPEVKKRVETVIVHEFKEEGAMKVFKQSAFLALSATVANIICSHSDIAFSNTIHYALTSVSFGAGAVALSSLATHKLIKLVKNEKQQEDAFKSNLKM